MKKSVKDMEPKELQKYAEKLKKENMTGFCFTGRAESQKLKAKS